MSRQPHVQDWEPLVLRKKKPTGTKPSNESGGVARRQFGTGNSQGGAAVYARKLDDETEDFRHKKIPQKFKVAMMKARQAKGWTQKELAQKIQEKPTVINDYESGKVVPNHVIIGKLNRALGVSLPKIPKLKK